MDLVLGRYTVITDLDVPYTRRQNRDIRGQGVFTPLIDEFNTQLPGGRFAFLELNVHEVLNEETVTCLSLVRSISDEVFGHGIKNSCSTPCDNLLIKGLQGHQVTEDFRMEDLYFEIHVRERGVSLIRPDPTKDGCRIKSFIMELTTGPVINVKTGDGREVSDPFLGQHHRPYFGWYFSVVHNGVL
ncbi:hypothetical protein D9M70_426990 [compost metagenome]